MSDTLICPVCVQNLVIQEKAVTCTNGHSFDIAKEGYLNLLTSRGKPSLIQGDTTEMIKNRRLFLEKGYFDPLLASLLEMVKINSPDTQKINVLDAGCGEGYYLGRMSHLLPEKQFEYYGIDISKQAISLAAKKYKKTTFCVADINKLLPFCDGSIDIMFNIFAPRNISEFNRILGPLGTIITVVPGSNHIVELRERLDLLDIEADKVAKLQEKFVSFELTDTKNIKFELKLDSESVVELIQMTPNAWFADRSRLIEAGGLAAPAFSTTAEFELLVFKRKA